MTLTVDSIVGTYLTNTTGVYVTVNGSAGTYTGYWSDGSASSVIQAVINQAGFLYRFYVHGAPYTVTLGNSSINFDDCMGLEPPGMVWTLVSLPAPTVLNESPPGASLVGEWLVTEPSTVANIIIPSSQLLTPLTYGQSFLGTWFGSSRPNFTVTVIIAHNNYMFQFNYPDADNSPFGIFGAGLTTLHFDDGTTWNKT